MIRFPIDLRILLMKAGFRISPWKPEFNEMPEIQPEDPEVLRYEFGTIHGILCMTSKGYFLTLIAIANQEPGNGNFARAMDSFEDSAVLFGRHMQVASIWNLRLLIHLVKKRGYKPETERADSVTKHCPGLKVP